MNTCQRFQLCLNQTLGLPDMFQITNNYHFVLIFNNGSTFCFSNDC